MNDSEIDEFLKQYQGFTPVMFMQGWNKGDSDILAAILNDYKRLRSQPPADDKGEQRRWERYCLHMGSGWSEVESLCRADVELDIYYNGHPDMNGKGGGE